MAARHVRSPGYGTIRSLLLFALLVLVVDRATDAVVGTLRSVAPTVDPGLLTTALAAVLWVALAWVAVGEVTRQRRATFRVEGTEAAVDLLDDRRPDRRGWGLAAGAALAGAVAAVLTRKPFLAVLDAVLFAGRRLAETGSIDGFSPTNLALGAVFLGGVLAVAWGLDRLVVGLVRDLQYRRATR